VKYDDDFKARAVKDLRDSRDAPSQVARRLGVAPSTLVRWDAQFVGSEGPANDPESPGARQTRELTDLLQRLDRTDQQVRLEMRIARHNRRVSLYNRASEWIGAALSFLVVVALSGGYYALYTDPSSSFRGYLGWTLAVIVAYWVVVAILGMVIVWLASLFGGAFVFTYLELFSAQETLTQDTKGELVDPRLWHLRARYRRRRLRASLHRAETTLMRPTLLGRAFQTAGAREWELAQRRHVAATIGYVETMLELEGRHAYERAAHLLREVAYLTLMRDWALKDLPVLEDPSRYESRYRSPLGRAASRLWAPVPVLGTLTAAALSIPDVVQFLRNLN